MAEWEEKLGAILNNPQAMSQIMGIAQSLSGETKSESKPETPSAPTVSDSPAPAIFGDDAGLMELGLRALTAYQDPGNNRAALLQALRPYIKAERYAKMDKAIEIARISKAIRAVLDGLKEGGNGV